MIPKINSAHGSDTRNIINRTIEVLNHLGIDVQTLVAEGQLTPSQYAELITVINGLIKSGHVDKGDLTPEFNDEIEGFSAQLAQTVAEKIGGGVKAEPEDLSATTLGLVTGTGGPINLLSIPQDGSVSDEKLDKSLGEYLQSPLENIVKNGNFSEGTNRWVGTTSTISASNNTLQMTANGSSINGVAYQQISGINLNHFIYTKMRVRVTNADCTRIEIQYRGSGSGTTSKKPIIINSPVKDQWYEISGRELPNTASGDLRIAIMHYYDLPETALNKVMEAQQVLAIDLTETYGSGNEPSYIKMDSILAEMNLEWFDKAPMKAFLKHLETKTDNISKTTDFPVTNVIRNGDFSDGINEWSKGYSYGEITTSNNELTYTISTPNSSVRIEQNSWVPIVGDKYYISLETYADKVADVSTRFGGKVVDERLVAGEWNHLRTVIESSSNNSFSFYVKAGHFTAGDFFKVRRVMVINLTKDFGKGNEPTAIEMEYLLSKYPNHWFNGTVNSILGMKELYREQLKIKPNYIFTDELTGTYLTDTVETFSDPSNAQISVVYAKYDNLQSQYSNYISKELLGQDGTGLDIYKYTFKPHILSSKLEVNIPKVIITTGTHGNEKSPVYSLYALLEQICNNWRNDPILEFLRFNVEFVIVPVVNPSGFNAGTRYNHNGVDLNRNFPTGWNASYTAAGSSAASELETQLILDLLADNEGTEYLIDYHNMAFRDGYMGYGLASNYEVNEITNRTLNTMGRKWQGKYEFFPQEENHQFGYTTSPIKSSLAHEATNYGMKDLLLEVVSSVQWQSNWSMYDELTVKCGTELLTNNLKGLIKIL